ncbi:GGDEF domain-containing protein [Anaerotignum sp.]|uniref:GGDEF domain-containing protein n=1 Tax=Anaerotignum sp. TaxID=2039241 RepID=UPI002896FCED|nr:GGDEF domain-containing protein [Anaerotignum sp.]
MDNLSKFLRKLGHWKENLLAEKVDLYKEEICNRNYNNFLGLTTVGIIITCGILLVGLPLSEYFTFNSQIFVLLGLCVILYLIAKFYLHKKKKYIILIFYCALSPVMFMGILMGTFLDSGVPSITIMVFLCVLTLFMIDKPWRIIFFISCSAVIYAVLCYFAKPKALFISDMMHLLAFYCLALGVNVLTLNERIENVESFVKYKSKSEIDQMTGVYNREVGLFKIKQLIYNQIKGSFIILDIDDFKKINDHFGHMYGDSVIKEISRLIKGYFSGEDIVLRMGGDEFIVYSINLIEMDECRRELENLLNSLQSSAIGRDKGISVSFSIGCAINDKDKVDFNRLYRDSDQCLYVAKNSGKGCCVIKK